MAFSVSKGSSRRKQGGLWQVGVREGVCMCVCILASCHPLGLCKHICVCACVYVPWSFATPWVFANICVCVVYLTYVRTHISMECVHYRRLRCFIGGFGEWKCFGDWGLKVFFVYSRAGGWRSLSPSPRAIESSRIRGTTLSARSTRWVHHLRTVMEKAIFSCFLPQKQ